MLQKRQVNISPQRGMNIHEENSSSSVTPITGETVQLYYYDGGTTLTADAGQAVGTVVVGTLEYHPIKNALGTIEATYLDTSLSFTSTALTSEVDFDWTTAEKYDDRSAYDRAVAITANLKNGQYCVDYTKGHIYGKKADTSTSLTATAYKVCKPSVALSSTTVTLEAGDLEIGAVELKDGTTDTRGKIGTASTIATTDYAVAVADPVAASSDASIAGNTYKKTVLYDETGAIISPTNPLNVVNVNNPLDDSVFTPGASQVLPAGFVYDDTSTDSISEGDVGAARMSADRVLYSQGAVAHDAVDSGNPISIGGIARAAQQTAVAAADRVKSVFNLFGEQVVAGYNWLTNSLRTEEINPISAHYVVDSLVDTTNVAAAATYFPSSAGMSMDGYNHFTLTGKYVDAHAVTTTLSVQGTNDEDTTNADWINIQGQINGLESATVAIPTVTGTVAGVTGVAVVPGTVCDLITTAIAQTVKFTWDFDNCGYKNIRVVLTPGDATNTTILKSKRFYA